jgi:dTMP kinase
LVKRATRRGKKRQLLTPTTFSLVHATDFADRYERQILPMLKGGYVVLCDRYTYTSFARDAVRGCNPGWLRKLYGFARKPDVTFYFRVPLSVALQRILEGRPRLKYFEAGMDLGYSSDIRESFRIFQQHVMGQYESMAEEFGFLRVEATRPIHDQQAEVRRLLRERIDLARFRQRGTR